MEGHLKFVPTAAAGKAVVMRQLGAHSRMAEGGGGNKGASSGGAMG